MQKAKTVISDNLQHVTKFIDPGSGQVLREGTDPISTVQSYRDNPTQPQVEDEDDTEERLDKVEKGIDEIKELLTKSLNK